MNNEKRDLNVYQNRIIKYFVEKLEIGPDSETLIVVIAEKQWL